MAPSLVPLQVFVTERDNIFASWKLLCNPLPCSLEHYQYLWPSESKVPLLAILCSLTRLYLHIGMTVFAHEHN